jgi:hypothetical protein
MKLIRIVIEAINSVPELTIQFPTTQKEKNSDCLSKEKHGRV